MQVALTSLSSIIDVIATLSIFDNRDGTGFLSTLFNFLFNLKISLLVNSVTLYTSFNSPDFLIYLPFLYKKLHAIPKLLQSCNISKESLSLAKPIDISPPDLEIVPSVSIKPLNNSILISTDDSKYSFGICLLLIRE